MEVTRERAAANRKRVLDVATRSSHSKKVDDQTWAH
jgi:hypothetical protein